MAATGLVMAATGKTSNLKAVGAVTGLVVRLAYFFLYVAGVPLLRTIV